MRRLIFLVLVATMMPAASALASDEAEAPEPKPEFSEAYLNDEKAQAIGKDLWAEQCRHCHGAKAYPGKAPKLKPRKYKPGFVFRRITKGFRKMPPWKEVYTFEERKALVAYIKSRKFSP